MDVDLPKISMSTVTGKRVYPFAMTPDQVEIQTIAHHLAVQARWNGATKHPIWKDKILLSVAEHSINVANHVRKELHLPHLTLQALLHDATEAYVPDLIRPLKHSPVFAEPFSDLEQKIWLAIAEKYDLPETLDPAVKLADDAVAYAEWEQVVPHDPGEEWKSALTDGVQPAPVKIGMWEPHYAKDYFLRYFNTMIVETHRSMDLIAA